MSKIQASRANTLDGFLEELPELPSGYFSFPVDDFFDNYVEELGQRGLQSRSLQAPTTDPGQYDSLKLSDSPNDISSGNQQTIPLDAAMSLDLPLIPDAEQAPQPNSIPYLTDSTLKLSNATPSEGFRTTGASKPENTQAPSGVGEQADTTSNRPKRNIAYVPPDYQAEVMGIDSDDSDQKHSKTSRAGKTKRNAKQQVQNKQAQQRYRERRKQRFSEMEHTIDGLNTQVQHMHAVQSQNSMLQAQREELEAMLREKESELEVLRSQVQKGHADAEGASENSSPEKRQRAEEAKARECQAKAAEHVQALRDFIDAHHLRSANPTGQDVDSSILQHLAELVGRGCNTCQNAMRAEGVKVLKLMSQDVTHLSRIDCLRQCNKWTKVLETLQLTDLQKEQLLLLRKNHLRNLRQVYEARQQLNMRAMSLMLSSAEEKIGLKDLDGKMACMSLGAYSNCARQSVDLDEILNSIRENLRLEQKHVMEMNFITMHRLMSPLQAALFLVDAHPSYCDALALANILGTQLEGDQKSGRAGPLCKANSGGSEGSPASSDNKSDTCRVVRGELELREVP